MKSEVEHFIFLYGRRHCADYYCRHDLNHRSLMKVVGFAEEYCFRHRRIDLKQRYHRER
jgi:hypothetical protein